jgi:hypothetical protein
MKQYINEAKRMQQLAGILNENAGNRDSVKEGFNLFLEIMDYEGVLKEDEGDEAIAKLGQKGGTFFNLLQSVYEQVSPDGQSAIKAAIQDIVKTKPSPEEVKQQLAGVKEAEESEEDLNPGSGIGKLRKFLNTTKLGGLSKAIMGLIVGTAMFATPLANALKYNDLGPKTVKVQADKTFLDTKIKSSYGSADNVGIKIGDKTLTSVDSEDNTTVNYVNYAFSKAKTLSPDGQDEYQKTLDGIKKVAKENPEDSITVDVTGTASNNGPNAEKASDAKGPLSKERTTDLTNKLKADLENAGIENVKVSEKPNPTDNYKSQQKEPSQGNEGAGVVVKTHIDKKDIPVQSVNKLLPQFNPLWAKIGGAEEQPTVQTEPGTEPAPTGGGEQETLPKTEPAPTVSTAPTDVKSTIAQFTKLNRNGQIATVLAKINPGLDISKKLGTNDIESYTDSFFQKTQGDAKKLAALIVNIRKNPDAFLKKVSKATGIKLEPRAKAVATRQGRNTQAQLQAIKESTSLIYLLEEAMIDQISDDNIKNNQNLILALLGTMYASAGNTELSIIPKDSAQAQELKGLGFTPQPGGNYVFLAPGQTKKQVQKPDVTRAADAISKNSSLVTALKRINNKEELKNLLLNITQYVNNNIKSKPEDVRRDLLAVGNKISLSEKDQTPQDVTNVIKILDRYTGLKNLLDRIGDREEFKQFLTVLLSFIDKNLFDRKSDVRGAAFQAGNELTYISKDKSYFRDTNK